MSYNTKNFIRQRGAEWVVGGKLTFLSGAIMTTQQNIGAAAAGVIVVENGGAGGGHNTVLTVASVLPAIAGGAALGVGKLLYTLPAGNCIIESAYMSMAIMQTQGHINANTPGVGVGTVIASGAVSDITGTPAFENVLVNTAAANCTGTPTVLTAIPTAAVPLVIKAADAHTLYFNAAATWSASGDAAAILTGTVIINWRFMA
jgi:hypothetical protein